MSPEVDVIVHRRKKAFDMWTWIKQFFYNERARGASQDARARVELDRLRREELSVGAQLRRGLPVSSAPGQVFSTKAMPSTSPARTNEAGARALTPVPENFETSFVVSLAASSLATGYGVGGSIAGASIGDTISQSAEGPNDRCLELPPGQT